jgi:hypothetical protein
MDLWMSYQKRNRKGTSTYYSDYTRQRITETLHSNISWQSLPPIGMFQLEALSATTSVFFSQSGQPDLALWERRHTMTVIIMVAVVTLVLIKSELTTVTTFRALWNVHTLRCDFRMLRCKEQAWWLRLYSLLAFPTVISWNQWEWYFSQTCADCAC